MTIRPCTPVGGDQQPMRSDTSRTYLAVDLGASSGRVVAGRFDGRQLRLDEVHRFTNGPTAAGGHLYWDLLGLWTHIQDGLRLAGEKYGSAVTSIGMDTWGVDFGLLGRNDELLGNPMHYRDPYTRGMMERAWQIVGREEIFAETGLQFMELNTLYQLLALRRSNSSLLEAAETFLLMPDLFNWLLTGAKVNEFTHASTTQFLNPRTGDWARGLLERFDIPTTMLQSIVQPGTDVGPLRAEVAATTGLRDVSVVLPGTHDTASAVLAVPAMGQRNDPPDWCYISSGTWSLLGAEVKAPVINDLCRQYNFTNEGGVASTIRLLKNITGLWLVQECRRVWSQAGRSFGWDELTALAEQAPPLESLIDPDDSRFGAPTDMPEAICEYCRQTGQPVPSSEGAVIRCALESLALRCRMVLCWLESLTESRFETIHIVGGGTKNQQLCQMTANACNRTVLAGPVEATAIGNVMMQAIARGDVDSVEQGRQMIAASFPLDRYDPRDPEPWDDAYPRFEALLQASES